MSRFACVWVPNFTAAAAERGEPALRERPLGILIGAPPATRVVDANDAAREFGVRSPMTEAEARACCPALVTRAISPDGVASARQALLQAALGVSPRIEDAAPGLVYVDVAGLGRLIGDAAAVGARLGRLATSVGLPPQVGIAGSRIAARVAAVRGASRVSVIVPGDERVSLAPAPLAVLELPADLAATLARWGVTTLGELAALPRQGLADRLGPAGLRAHEQALGRDREPFRPYAPPPFWQEVQGLEWEIDTLPALTVALERVLGRLGERLGAAHVAADALTVQLQLASGGRYDRTIPLAYPMVDVGSMLIVLRSAFEAQPPAAAVTRIALSVRAVPARAAPRGLWQPPAPAPRDLGAALARLVALVGVENVGSPLPVASHRSDAFILAPFATENMGGLEGPPKPPGARRAAASPRRASMLQGDSFISSELEDRGPTDRGATRRRDRPAPRSSPAVPGPWAAEDARAEPCLSAAPLDGEDAPIALRRLRPPRRIEVECTSSPPRSPGDVSLPPRRVCLDGHTWTRVLGAAGPWRVSGEWWDTRAWARDEWDLALADGTLWLVARDRVAGDWYLDGAYD